MSEMRLPERSDSPEPPPTPAAEARAGSLALGVGLAWAINVVGNIVVLMVAMLSGGRSGSLPGPIAVLALLPFLISVGLAIWMIVKGPKRTGIGIIVGIGSIWAVALLMIAACFGIIFAVSGGGGAH